MAAVTHFYIQDIRDQFEFFQELIDGVQYDLPDLYGSYGLTSILRLKTVGQVGTAAAIGVDPTTKFQAFEH